MLRYLKRLETARPLADDVDDPARLVHDEAERDGGDDPVTWPEFGKIHPFAPVEQAKGYREMFDRLETRAGRDHRASPRCRCSRTPGRRASTRACS